MKFKGGFSALPASFYELSSQSASLPPSSPPTWAALWCSPDNFCLIRCSLHADFIPILCAAQFPAPIPRPLPLGGQTAAAGVASKQYGTTGCTHGSGQSPVIALYVQCQGPLGYDRGLLAATCKPSGFVWKLLLLL